jgi:periplasmic divalent cation tolerance protein
MQDQAIVVMITAPSPEAARQLAEMLLEKKLAACVNILPAVSSLFNWQGQRSEEQEALLLVKSRLALFAGQLVPAVQAAHPYETPEIIALPVIAGMESYLDWIKEETNAE